MFNLMSSNVNNLILSPNLHLYHRKSFLNLPRKDETTSRDEHFYPGVTDNRSPLNLCFVQDQFDRSHRRSVDSVLISTLPVDFDSVTYKSVKSLSDVSTRS